MMKAKKHSGFTLVEMIVVVVLIGITLSLSMPRFQEAVLVDKTKKFSRWIMLNTKELKARAFQEKKLYILNIGMDSGKLWVTTEGMSEESLLAAEDNGQDIPEDVRILDVEYPEKGKIGLGTAEICFYRNGCSDKVLIHIEDEENNQITFLIEPFLSKVKMYDEYVGFEG